MHTFMFIFYGQDAGNEKVALCFYFGHTKKSHCFSVKRKQRKNGTHIKTSLKVKIKELRGQIPFHCLQSSFSFLEKVNCIRLTYVHTYVKTLFDFPLLLPKIVVEMITSMTIWGRFRTDWLLQSDTKYIF